MDVLDFRLFFGPFGQLEGGRASEADQVTLKFTIIVTNALGLECGCA